MQKAKEKYHNCGGKEKAANSRVLKEKAKSKYKSLSEEEKEAKWKYEKNRYRNTKKNAR